MAPKKLSILQKKITFPINAFFVNLLMWQLTFKSSWSCPFFIKQKSFRNLNHKILFQVFLQYNLKVVKKTFSQRSYLLKLFYKGKKIGKWKSNCLFTLFYFVYRVMMWSHTRSMGKMLFEWPLRHLKLGDQACNR